MWERGKVCFSIICVHCVDCAWEQTNRPSQKCATFYSFVFSWYSWRPLAMKLSTMHATAPGILLWLDWCPGGAVLLPSIILRPQKNEIKCIIYVPPFQSMHEICLFYFFHYRYRWSKYVGEVCNIARKQGISPALQRNEALESAAMQRAKKVYDDALSIAGLSEVAHNLDGYILEEVWEGF